MKHKVLVVDDKVNMRRLIREYLTEHDFMVCTASNGREAYFVAREEQPDLILLDIMMPELDGYEFIRLWRQEHQTPIILVTAKLEEDDKVVGLELGADDYLTKPFGMRELLARIKAVLRRAGLTYESKDVVQVGDLRLDKDRWAIYIKDREVTLTPSEFDLLATLMSAPNRVFPRAELLGILQGPLSVGTERTIDVHVRNIRAKIEPDSKDPQYIETVFGVGYRLKII